MGNVLLRFSHRRSASQLAAVLGIDEDAVWQFVFTGSPALNDRCDSGEVPAHDFRVRLCREFCGDRPWPDQQSLTRAAGDIFEVNAAMLPIVAQLRAAGYGIGLLSNTCDMHWEFILSRRYALFPHGFDALLLSYQEKLMKPQPEIYRLAAQRAGVEPGQIVYVDDLEPNVAGARAAGLDAILFTTAAAYADELRQRGIRFNY